MSNDKPVIGAPEIESLEPVEPKTVDEAKVELQKARDALRAANAESADRRRKLKAFEDAEAVRQADEQKRRDAELSEVERLRLAAAKAESDGKQALSDARKMLMRAAVHAEAQAQNVDPAEFGSVWKELRDDPNALNQIVDTADGMFDGVKAAVAAVVKAHPRWLAPAPTEPLGTPPANQRRGQGVNTVQPETLEQQKEKLRASGHYSPA